MLSFLVLMPLVGSLLLVTMPMTVNLAKMMSMLVSVMTFWMSIYIYLEYDSSMVGYQNMGNDILSMGFAIDGMSMPFILLTGFLTPIVLLASWNMSTSVYPKGFLSAQLLTESFLMLVWLVTDLMTFYVAFEAVLIPLFITVGVWGSSVTRVRSAFLLFMYTLSGSLLMLMSLVSMYMMAGTGNFSLLMDLNLGNQSLIWLGIFLAFAVKTPMVPFHMWLPRAHADAPLAASMVLAGTVLKMATYGYLRMCLGLMPVMTSYYVPLVQAMSTISVILSSLATLRQSDMKAVIAYSSVGHMAVVTLGVFSNSMVGILGGILLGLAHGFVSPGLFMITGGVLYDRYHTRIMSYYRGLALRMPVMATLFFVLTLSNMGVPLSLNWMGEFLSLLPITNQNPLICSFALLSVVLSASYSIYLYVRMNFGSYSRHLIMYNDSSSMAKMSEDVNRREFWVMLYLIIPVFVFGIYTIPITNCISVTVSSLVIL